MIKAGREGINEAIDLLENWHGKAAIAIEKKSAILIAFALSPLMGMR